MTRRGRIARLALAAAAAALAAVLWPLQPPALAGQPAQEQPARPLSDYDEAVDAAVERGLTYLAAQQKPDGSFPGSMDSNVGIASLCMMAFMAQGHTPGIGQYGAVLNKGVDYAVSTAQPNGLLVSRSTSHGPMYEHSITTLFLSEVSGMVDPDRQARIDKVLPRALEVILAAQKVNKGNRHQGGWRYQPNSTDSDISCTGWPLMALRSARNNGAPVPEQAIADALTFIMNCRTPDGGFAYQPGGGPGPARTGTGLLCLELIGKHRDEAALAAGDWILAHPNRRITDEYFYYGLYYCAQGTFQLGGNYWDTFARNMYEIMLPAQTTDGSWPVPGGSEGSAGRCYSTAMAVLALGVPYCQLPIYQR